MSLQNSNPDFT